MRACDVTKQFSTIIKARWATITTVIVSLHPWTHRFRSFFLGRRSWLLLVWTKTISNILEIFWRNEIVQDFVIENKVAVQIMPWAIWFLAQCASVVIFTTEFGKLFVEVYDSDVPLQARITIQSFSTMMTREIDRPRLASQSSRNLKKKTNEIINWSGTQLFLIIVKAENWLRKIKTWSILRVHTQKN